MIAVAIMGCNPKCHNSKEYSLEPTPQERAAIQDLIIKSQTREIEFYMRPDQLKATDLSVYWLPAKPNEPSDWKQIESGTANLISHGWHYANPGEKDPIGSRNEMLRFDHIAVNADRTAAEVQTYEKWYCPVYDAQHKEVKAKNPVLGPYPVCYIILKAGTTWRVNYSTTPRPNRRRLITGIVITAAVMCAIVILLLLILYVRKYENSTI